MSAKNDYLSNIRFISAGAGSGKTYRLTEELQDALVSGRVKPSGIIGTTFTNKAAGELKDRVRQHLIQNGHLSIANAMGQAMLGTVHSVCGRFLGRFAFEAGLSPELAVLSESDAPILFNQALESAITLEKVRKMNSLCRRMGIENWQGKVKGVVDAARANGIHGEKLHLFGKSSAESLLSHFPSPIKHCPSDALLKSIKSAIAALETNDDKTKKTKGYLKFLKQIKGAVENRALPWKDWVKLSKESPAKKSMEWAEPVMEAARQYDASPELRGDINDFCETLFSIAAHCLESYQAHKREKGMLDFVDQEQLMLELLEHPTVFQTLRDELDLLLVDEFQDTSPIQLALFLKLASAAKETVLVGDVKQSIYGFRGCDPDLMQATLKAVMSQGGQTEVLENSWRSRPELVEYVNELFVPAFSGTLPEDQVKLIPVREPLPAQTAVENWNLIGSNMGNRAAAMAKGVQALIDSRHRVVDPASKEVRDVGLGDIAILARTNGHVETFANAFSAAGIPVKRERSGLLSTPEAILATACLRRLADPGDTLASAEIITLIDCDEPETWLQNRLEYLEAGNPGNSWGENDAYRHPAIDALAPQRPRLQFLTPTEALNLAINVTDTRRAIISWGPSRDRATQRLVHLDTLCELAQEYERHCGLHHAAATVTGLLLWLENLKKNKQDKLPEDPKTDAVHLSTHHGAKGLEWPVVIATDLNSDIQTRLWDLNVLSENGKIDLDNPLANRALRFWPWPFGKQSKGIAVSDGITASAAGNETNERDIAEIKRLLYVSMTRARDLLIIALPEKKKTGPWIETLDAPWMLPSGDQMLLPSQGTIPTANRSFEAPDAPHDDTTGQYRPFWFKANKSPSEKLPEIISPSKTAAISRAGVMEIHSTGDRISVKGSPEMSRLGDAFHTIIAAEIINPAHKDAITTTRRILDNFSLGANVEPGDALKTAQNFNAFTSRFFNPSQVLAEYPVEQVLENSQVVKGWIDTLVEVEDGWIIIDHKSSLRPKKELPAEALKYSGQLLAYKKAVEAATSKNVVSCWIHFPISGQILKLSV